MSDGVHRESVNIGKVCYFFLKGTKSKGQVIGYDPDGTFNTPPGYIVKPDGISRPVTVPKDKIEFVQE